MSRGFFDKRFSKIKVINNPKLLGRLYLFKLSLIIPNVFNALGPSSKQTLKVFTISYALSIQMD